MPMSTEVLEMVRAAYVEKVVDVPDGVQVTLEGNTLKVRGPLGEVERRFVHPRLKMTVEDSQVKVYCELPKKKEAALVGTWEAHVRNMIKGVTEGFEYKMKLVYSHFPVKVSVKKDQLFVENFLGEKHPRVAKILPGVKVKISGDTITLTGVDKEKVGQTAANIEKATRVKGYDVRVFQDGIYIVSKGG